MAHNNSMTLLVNAFSPFNSLTLNIPSSTTLSDVYGCLCEKYPSLPPHLTDILALSTHAGIIVDYNQPLSSLYAEDKSPLVTLRLTPRLLGGKGGFGSQLRAAGGRMSSQKTSNNDSCRDLNGRRLSTIKEAKMLAEHLASEPERRQAKAEAQRAKLEDLEKKLGIEHRESRKAGEVSVEVLSGKKHRFDDTEYLEQSRELVDGVKSAVSVALLKKRKKAKASPLLSAGKKAASEEKGKEKEKEAEEEKSEPTPVVPVVIAEAPSVSAIALDAVGA